LRNYISHFSALPAGVAALRLVLVPQPCGGYACDGCTPTWRRRIAARNERRARSDGGKNIMTTALNLSAATELAADIEKRWSDFSLAGDIDGLLPMFTEDVVFFGSLPQMFLGREGVRKYLSSVSMSAARAVTFFDRQVRVLTPDVFTTSSLVFFDLELEGKMVRWRFGITWTVIRREGDWKIALHHASPREEKK
jgi:uncharacterized protein (TIGR02246 family)